MSENMEKDERTYTDKIKKSFYFGFGIVMPWILHLSGILRILTLTQGSEIQLDSKFWQIHIPASAILVFCSVTYVVVMWKLQPYFSDRDKSQMSTILQMLLFIWPALTILAYVASSIMIFVSCLGFLSPNYELISIPVYVCISAAVVMWITLVIVNIFFIKHHIGACKDQLKGKRYWV